MAFPSISTPVTGGQFSAADGTTLQAANASFVKYSGASDIVTASGVGKIGSGTYSEYGYHVDPGSALVEFIIDIVAKSSGNRANGLWANFFSGTAPGSTSSDRNGHQIEIDFSSTAADALFIYTVANGTNTQVATSTATTFSAGDSIGARISGTTNRLIEIFRKTGGVWNQTPVLTFTDTSAPANRQDVNSFAFGVTDSSGGPLRFDNLVFGATSSAVDATITAVPAQGVDMAPAPTITTPSAGSVTAVPAQGTGQASAPTPSAGASITPPAAGGTGTAVPPENVISAEITTPAASGVGSAPAPTVSGSGSATVSPPAASEQGAAPAPSASAGATVSPGPASATDRAPAPTVSTTGNATIAAPAAGSTGGAPAPGVSDGTAQPSRVAIGMRRSIDFTIPGRTASFATAGPRRIAFNQPRRTVVIEQAERIPVTA